MGVYRIKEGELAVGKPLARPALDKNGVLLLRRGYVINSQAQLDALLERGLFFSDDQSRDVPAPEPEPAVEEPTPFELIDDAYRMLERIFGRIAANEGNFVERIHRVGQLVVQACEIDEDATLGSILTLLWNENRYVIHHPIHTAMITNILMHRQNIPIEKRMPAICAALTMNISVLKLQEVLVFQKEPLTEEQKKLIHEHPTASVKMLEQLGVTDADWLEAVAQHHEVVSGKGYPKGLKDDELSFNGAIVMLADNYCAKISGRAYREGKLPNVALREIFLSKELVKPEIAAVFIKEVGVYPPGSFVKLVNGEIAVVTKRGVNASTPIVHSVVGPRGAPLAIPIQRDCSKDKLYAIQSTVTGKAADIKVNPYQLWGYVKKTS